MHKHHGTLRLLITILTLIVLGCVAYVLIVYAMARVQASIPVPVQPTTTSTLPIATSASATSSSSTSIGSTASTTPSWEKGMQIVTQSDNNGVVHLTKDEQFVIQLGSGLNWSIVFDPASSISRVPNAPTANGIQGIYEADAVGTTTLRATGAPICTAYQACPMFLAVTTITLVVR